MRRVDRLLQATALAEGRHFWFRGLRAFATPLIRRSTATVSAPRILDCGCGTGANLGVLARFGRAYGFDRSSAGLRLARASGRHDLTRASVAAVPFPGAAFDLVTSFDVLYALDERDERAAVSEMYRLLKPGGYAIVNVAAMGALRGDHSVLSHERRRYTRQSLRRLLEAAGFVVVRLTYTNASLFVPLALVRTLQRWRGLSSEDDATREITVPPAPVNALLSGLLLLESVWVRRLDEPFGSSLLCLARKPAA